MAKKYLVKFINVGRGDKNWSLETDHIGFSELIRAIKKQRALVSREIDIEIDNETQRGFIYAGGREVGQIEIALNAQEQP